MEHQAHAAGHSHDDAPAGHGMLVVGLEATFFYHLAMFMSPHDYQVILEGSLSKQGSDPQKTYREDRKSHLKTTVYTLAPVPFVLPATFPPALKLKKVQGDLFRGHFESPPEYPAKPSEIGSGVDVTIARVVFVQKLLPPPTALKQLEYLLFGTSNELFMAHLITKKGDFDQVVSAEIKGHQFTNDELQRGIRVQFSGQANTAAQKLVAGKVVSGSARVADKDLAIEVTPRVEFYMSERDLI
ncbi:MAG: hypothetical protein ABMA15_19080 [Vicinamibacterales bacterium]